MIGVCNAADPTDREGLFVALEAICAQLDQDQLAFVYKSPAGGAAGAPEAADPAGIPPSAPPAVFDPMAGRADLAASGRRAQPGGGRRPVWPSHEQAALDEIRRSLREGAEVVVVVRPRGNPDAHSEVIMLDHVSPEFLKRLAAERRSPDDNVPVSRESSKPRRSGWSGRRPRGVPGRIRAGRRPLERISGRIPRRLPDPS